MLGLASAASRMWWDCLPFDEGLGPGFRVYCRVQGLGRARS